MPHSLEAVSSPSLIFLNVFYVLPLKLFYSLSYLTTHAIMRQLYFLIVQISAGVDPGSQNAVRIGGPCGSWGCASNRLTMGSSPGGLFLSQRARSRVINFLLL